MVEDANLRHRWFRPRRRALLFLALVAAVVAAGWFAIAYLQAWQVAKRREAALAAEEAGYREHRVLVWTFDENAPDAPGFAETTLAPEHSACLEPLSDLPFEIQFGKVAAVEIMMLPKRATWNENHLSYKMHAATTGLEGCCDLRTPCCSTMWLGGGRCCVCFLIPLGSRATESLVKELPGELHGGLGELEDVLLACLDPMLHDDAFDLSDVTEFYSVVGRSQRTDRWRQLLHGSDRQRRLLAAAALMRVGDEEGTNVLCGACLAAQGNEQVFLVELLPQMPSSEKSLETIVALITSPRETYVIDYSADGVGVADKDRRGSLLEALRREYVKEQVLPYKFQLMQWASASGNEWAKKQLTDFFK